MFNRQGVLITSNAAARYILADVSSDFLSDILHELPPIPVLAPENGSDLNQDLELAMQRQPRRYQVGHRVLSALTAPVTTPGGERLGTVITLRDITREAESEQLKDGFITNISHELRTPLTAVKGYSDLLLRTTNGNLSEQHAQFVQIISQNADKLLYHINKIIDISEVQAGTLRLEKREICFGELVKEVVEHWREQFETKGLILQVRLPEQPLHVCGDPKRLIWAADNLLSNAYNYTLAGGRVEIRAFQENEVVRLDIIDTGVGIAIADQPYLFTRFFRASNQLTFNVPGVGLGLFITRSIVELHDGRVWAKSQLNSGSTFSLALPVLK
jgi:signal transduction histidine kinase